MTDTDADLTRKLETVIQKIPMRIEFGIGFSVKGAAQTATLWEKSEANRWKKSDLPFIVVKKEDGDYGDRADVLDQLAAIVRQAQGAKPQAVDFKKATTNGGDTVWEVSIDGHFVGIVSDHDVPFGESTRRFTMNRNTTPHALSAGHLEQIARFLRIGEGA